MEASVVLATFNRAIYLELTLESLLHQDFDRSRFEIVVVVDGSVDTTQAVLDRYGPRLGNLRTVRQGNRGPSSARNAGVQLAQGETIIFIDDDCICSPNLVRRHVEAHATGRRKAAIGVVRQVFSRLPGIREAMVELVRRAIHRIDPQAAPALEALTLGKVPDVVELLGVEDVSSRLAEIHRLSVDLDPVRADSLAKIQAGRFAAPWLWFFTNHASAKRADLVDIGLFDERFDGGWGVEDIDVGYRLFRAGVEFDALLDTTIYHQVHPVNWRQKTKQGYRNYIRMCEKYDDPTLYLQWQAVAQKVTMDEYDALARKIDSGLATEAERQAIRDAYDVYVGRAPRPDRTETRP